MEGDERPPPPPSPVASTTQDKKKAVIKIPSYQEVFESSSTANPYNPPSSFSQAFSFLKSSEFYSPPPPPQLSQQPSSQPSPAKPPAQAPSPSPSSSSGGSGAASVQGRNAILVSHRQKGNPLLKHIRNVRWMFADIVCDYLLGQSSCALFISLRYHLLHPDYLYHRIRELQKNYKLRVVLCHVDVEDVVKPLLEVTRTTMLHDCTLLCGWSLEECGRYLETIKVYENKPADSIREQMDSDYLSRLTHALTSIRHVNKTDVVTLGSTFGALSSIMDASMEDLARCPGIGERKVRRLYDTFHEPFRRVSTRPPISVPDVSTKEKGDTEDHSSVSEGAQEGRSDAPKSVSESDVTVKSALAAAFSKYEEKVRKGGGRRGGIVEHKEGQ